MSENEFSLRRKKLLNQLDKNALAILVAAKETVRNGDANYLYRQNSDFYYLTGFEEPEAVAIFAPNHEMGEFILFSRAKDKTKEIWDGYIAGQTDACEVFGADKAYPISQLMSRLPELMNGRDTVYYDFKQTDFDNKLLSVINTLKGQVRLGVKTPSEFKSLELIIHELRLFKSAKEIEYIKHAVNASVQGHKNAMKKASPGLYEYDLLAELVYEFQKNACFSPAYSPIVGSGNNSCILHYIKNNSPLNDGDLVLIDAGAEYQNYAADITRTFPVNGRYSKEQAQIYELVLKAQKAAIEVAKPGMPWDAMQKAIVQVLTRGLLELGILTGDENKLIEEKAYLPFYMHNSGHWLGLDVHDSGAYKLDGQWRSLEENMVLTIEPGIYISANAEGVADKWKGIGVRIEDDILITQTGNEVLSDGLAKEIAAVEDLMNS